MAGEDKKKSFLEIFAIVVGAIGTLFGGTAALLAVMNTGDEKTSDSNMQ